MTLIFQQMSGRSADGSTPRRSRRHRSLRWAPVRAIPFGGPPIETSISLWSDDTWLATLYTDEEVAPGKSTKGLIFDVDPDDVKGTLRAKADDNNGGGIVGECNEDNNSLKISKGLCK